MTVLIKAQPVTPEKIATAFDRRDRGFEIGFYHGHWWDMNVIRLGHDGMGLIEPLFPDAYTIVERLP